MEVLTFGAFALKIDESQAVVTSNAPNAVGSNGPRGSSRAAASLKYLSAKSSSRFKEYLWK